MRRGDLYTAAARGAYTGKPRPVVINGRVFTGRFGHPPTEVLFDRICRDNGVEHLLTAPRSPTTTGKIERFHRSCARSSTLTGCSPRSAPRRLNSTSGSLTTTPSARTRP